MPDSDWKRFRSLVPVWRERYLEKRAVALAEALTASSTSPTERFWATKREMDAEARTLVDCFDGHTRSGMQLALVVMHGHGVIESADLDGFSDPLRAAVARAASRLRA